MWNIPDDPIISCIERTGLPPWALPRRIWTPFGDSWVNEEDEIDEEYEDEYEDEDEDEVHGDIDVI